MVFSIKSLKTLVENIIMPASDNDSTYDISDDSFFIVEYDNLAGAFGTFEGSVFLIKQ